MGMHWNWLVVIYLFLGGLGAGAYLTSFAAEMGWLGKNSGLKRMGYYIAGPVVGIGTLLLVFDLGQGFYKPWLLIRLVTNFNSVMTWGTIVLGVFIGVGMLKGFLTFINKPVPSVVTWFGAVLAVATGGYTGFLVSVIEAIPFWNSGIIPAIFFISAMSTGLSLTVLLSSIFEKTESDKRREDLTHIVLIVAELAAVAVFMGLMITGTNGLIAQKSAAMIVSGKYAFQFWGIFIGLGLIFPLAVYIVQYYRSRAVRPASKASSGGANNAAAPKLQQHHSYLAIITDSSVLIGGLALRALVIFAALPIWDGIRIP
ncbi:MAG: polysulfide reductase NrfD [Syntrophomonas sp.]|nr:polysulfide reductase NrfD [Syntrophomonas sp.]